MATTIPGKGNTTIYQGSPWPGIRVRAMNETTGLPYDPAPEYTAQVRTQTIDQGGILLADCDITEEDDDWWHVSLTGAVTQDFPERTVYLDVDALLPDTDQPTVIYRLIVEVQGEITRD